MTLSSGTVICKRLIAVILLRDGRAVKSKRFGSYRDVGNPVSQAKILYANGIDEIVVLNTQPELGIEPLMDVLPKIGEVCFIPVAAGGGIRAVDDVSRLIAAGCEKVVIRTALHLIPEITRRFGCQSVIECRDYDDPAALSGQTEAGELLLQNTQRDGTMSGYDLLVGFQCAKPVIRLGGCGHYAHMHEALMAGADAVAAGSLWAFTDSNPLRAKSFLRNHGILCR